MSAPHNIFVLCRSIYTGGAGNRFQTANCVSESPKSCSCLALDKAITVKETCAGTIFRACCGNCIFLFNEQYFFLFNSFCFLFLYISTHYNYKFVYALYYIIIKQICLETNCFYWSNSTHTIRSLNKHFYMCTICTTHLGINKYEYTNVRDVNSIPSCYNKLIYRDISDNWNSFP